MNEKRFEELKELILQRLVDNRTGINRFSLMSGFYSEEHEEVAAVIEVLKERQILTEALGRISLKR